MTIEIIIPGGKKIIYEDSKAMESIEKCKVLLDEFIEKIKPTRLVLPLPPSVNSYWVRSTSYRGKRGMRRSDKAKLFLQLAMIALNKQNSPRFGPTPVMVDIYLHTRPQGGDRDNYNKGLLDALTHGRVWDDDDQVVNVKVHKRGTVKKGAAVIDIRPATQNEINQSAEVMPEVGLLKEWGLA